MIGFPIGDAKDIPFPHAVFPYVIPVSVSWALPRFSMTIHACAVEPGIPHPVVWAIPIGPLNEIPLVLFASTGIITVYVEFGDSLGVNVSKILPSSEPSASEGTLILRVGDQLSPESILIFSRGVKAFTVQFSGN